MTLDHHSGTVKAVGRRRMIGNLSGPDGGHQSVAWLRKPGAFVQVRRPSGARVNELPMTTSTPDATPSPIRDGDTEGGTGDERSPAPDLLVSRALPPRPRVAPVS